VLDRQPVQEDGAAVWTKVDMAATKA